MPGDRGRGWDDKADVICGYERVTSNKLPKGIHSSMNILSHWHVPLKRANYICMNYAIDTMYKIDN